MRGVLFAVLVLLPIRSAFCVPTTYETTLPDRARYEIVTLLKLDRYTGQVYKLIDSWVEIPHEEEYDNPTPKKPRFFISIQREGSRGRSEWRYFLLDCDTGQTWELVDYPYLNWRKIKEERDGTESIEGR